LHSSQRAELSVSRDSFPSFLLVPVNNCFRSTKKISFQNT